MAIEGALILSGGACCPSPAMLVSSRPAVDPAFVKPTATGAAHVDFLAPEMHCGDCLIRIERALHALPGVIGARANLTTRRIGIDFTPGLGDPDAMLAALERFGYAARPFDAASFAAAEDDGVQRELVRAMAVAGFAAANIMLLSVSVWSGADAATRDLFHWISALIALPTLVYAGRPFFRSAFKGLRAGHLNMDFPISLGVTLASLMSLYETIVGGEHAWFDASVTLLFLLLVGRFLDRRMRDVARSAATRLLSLAAPSASRLESDGSLSEVPIREILPGDLVLVRPGDRVPVDGAVVKGASDIDRSMLTGEPDAERVSEGARVFTGTTNLTGPLTLRTLVAAGDTLLAEIVRLTEAAERSQGRLVRLADRASSIYAPAVHLLAFATLSGWLFAGAGIHAALTAATAVLIITCPCALGLAVPAVQVVAGGFLLRRGIMLKDGSALERLSIVDSVAFDKTGTLTEGTPRLVESPLLPDSIWALAEALGRASRHPLAKALAEAARARGAVAAEIEAAVEQPGSGVEGIFAGKKVRLGRRDWVGGKIASGASAQSEIWLRLGEEAPLAFRFEDRVRADAATIIARLKSAGLQVSLLSGDRREVAAPLAHRLGIENLRADLRPSEKVAELVAAASAGRRTLMVGDGINDAPALASAYVSMAPSSGADISQTAASIVFTGKQIAPVAIAIEVARAARRLTLQNFALAIGYNAVAVPIAIFGHATPLIAAIAMSSSSILVTANALRLPWLARERPRDERTARLEPAGAKT